MRITKYEPSNESMFPYRLKDEELSTKLDSIHKLGQLEDIEEDFNCNLIIFLKALKHGVFYKDFGDNKIKHTNNLRISCYDGKTFCLENKWHSFLMDDYGKTKYNPWALTKEELEKK